MRTRNKIKSIILEDIVNLINQYQSLDKEVKQGKVYLLTITARNTTICEVTYQFRLTLVPSRESDNLIYLLALGKIHPTTLAEEKIAIKIVELQTRYLLLDDTSYIGDMFNHLSNSRRVSYYYCGFEEVESNLNSKQVLAE
jgi:hypothetical protein